MNTSTWNLPQHYPAVIGIKVIVLAPPLVCSPLVSRTYAYVVSFMFVFFVNCMWALVLLRWVDVKTVNIVLCKSRSERCKCLTLMEVYSDDGGIRYGLTKL